MKTIKIETSVGLARAHLELAEDSRAALILGHGAGGNVAARDLVVVKDVALSLGVSVSLIEQPYRVAGRRAPPPAQHLDAAWIAVIDYLREHALGGLRLIVGGRSSGARVACRTAEATGAIGVLCLAFPLQPPRRSGTSAPPNRMHELDAVTVPTLVVQGAQDPFGLPVVGARREVAITKGDHSLRVGLPEVANAAGAWLTVQLGHGDCRSTRRGGQRRCPRTSAP